MTFALSLPFTWPYLVAFWIVYIWAFAPEFAIIRRAADTIKRGESKDQGSMRVVMAGQQIGLTLSFFFSFIARLQMPWIERLICFWSGLGLLIAGSVLRRYCWRLLGEFFTGDVNARADQPVIQKGPYRYVRHPSYSGGILMAGGVALALGTWLGVVTAMVTAVAAYVFRIRVEERVLVETLGAPYAEYMQRSKRLVPFVI